MGLDSVELVMEVEKHFSISIPDKEAEKVYTVGNLVDCVSQIIGVTVYNYSLREKVFSTLQQELAVIRPGLQSYTLHSRIIESLDVQDKMLITGLEQGSGLQFPGMEATRPNNFWGKTWKWVSSENIDFQAITWERYLDMLLAANLEKLVAPWGYRSKYEIYVAIMRILVDKIGVNYAEIGLEKSFTDDLGID